MFTQSRILLRELFVILLCSVSEAPGSPLETGEIPEEEAEREKKKKEAERLQQELDTRRRIEARLRAKQEQEMKARRESLDKCKFGCLFCFPHLATHEKIHFGALETW